MLVQYVALVILWGKERRRSRDDTEIRRNPIKKGAGSLFLIHIILSNARLPPPNPTGLWLLCRGVYWTCRSTLAAVDCPHGNQRQIRSRRAGCRISVPRRQALASSHLSTQRNGTVSEYRRR